jgi:hypothetical protein
MLLGLMNYTKPRKATPMVELFALVIMMIALLVGLGVAALNWGVDSRDGSTDPRSPARPVGIV